MTNSKNFTENQKVTINDGYIDTFDTKIIKIFNGEIYVEAHKDHPRSISEYHKKAIGLPMNGNYIAPYGTDITPTKIKGFFIGSKVKLNTTKIINEMLSKGMSKVAINISVDSQYGDVLDRQDTSLIVVGIDQQDNEKVILVNSVGNSIKIRKKYLKEI